MRALVGLLTVVLSLLSFFPTAHADVIDPGNPYRRPHRPDLERPVTRVYRQREPNFTLTQVEGKDRTYLLKVTLPGPCQWGFRVLVEEEGTTAMKMLEKAGWFPVPDVKKETDSREFLIPLPKNKEKVKFLMAVDFRLYRFQETRYGPKVYGPDRKLESLDRVYELTMVDGKQILNK